MSENPSVNKGFQVFGGTVNTGPVAIGDNAQVHTGQSPVELVDAIRRLLAARDDLPPEAAEVTEEVADELGQETVDKGRLARLLDTLVKLVAPVEPVATAVSDLSNAVAAISS
ncbi:hypothetical protein V5P93_000501 [Actinokineospora auranticolor]|uniref:Uncharacterized protein n=1 Tax=Actinokineospora auranticolor TaxID=155976 RepID=A0A2S6GZF7_9PSEU|nr:hypothetical protein [Actinokineospora auranticolor]PPK70619.1 hypothetical protein CLV40_102536 [Actinokineospora auranticolor]